MKFTIEINNIKEPSWGQLCLEGNWYAEDSNGDDITYLVADAIPYACQDALGFDHNSIEDVELWHHDGSPIGSECKEGIFTAYRTE